MGDLRSEYAADARAVALMSVLRFDSNVPRTVALKYADGKEVESKFGGSQVLFTTVDGDTTYQPTIAAAQINELFVKPGQEIEITKLQIRQGKKDIYRWTVECARPEQ